MNVQAFLKDIDFIQTWDETALIEEVFVKHMMAGLEGDKGTIPMIPAFFNADAIPSTEEKVIALDAGGTNLRVSLLHVKPGMEAEVLYMHKQPMPGTQDRMDRNAFFDAIARAIVPIAEQSERIGFCFSFPCQILPTFDGKILSLDKEITVSDCEGALVGENLCEALARLGAPHNHRIAILNDTVAALLGASAEHPAQNYGGQVGCILGTGMNCCYSERNGRIIKDDALKLLPGSSIINTECGMFGADTLLLTAADEYVRTISKVKDGNLLEKMISGAYQGKVLDGLLKTAAQAGLFSETLCKHLNPGISAEDISQYLSSPASVGLLHNMASNDKDAHVLYELTDAVVERAALLAVMVMTAVMHFANIGTDPLRPVCIAIEGTTYEKNHVFRNKIQAHLIHYTQRIRGYHTRVVSTKNANLVGASIAALTL